MNCGKAAMLTMYQVQAILRPQTTHLGKSVGQMLWLHSFSVWSTLSKLAARIPRFTDRERVILEVSALVHDVGKLRADNQEILQGNRQGKVRHTASKEEIRDYLSPFVADGTIGLGDGDIERIWEFALHHGISEQQQAEAQEPAFGIYTEVLRYADWLASMRSPNMETIRQIQNALDGVLRLTVFALGRYPSPSTYYLLQDACHHYRDAGWEILSIYDNSAIFVGDAALNVPDKSSITKSFADKLVSKSFEDVSIRITFMRYEILSGEAKDDPYGFLTSKRGFYEDRLGDVDAAPVLFLKTLIDLYRNADKLTTKVKQALPVLEMLSKAGGTNGITQAKHEWNRRQKTNVEWPSTNAFIIDVFNNVSVDDVLLDANGKTGRQLRDFTSTELFGILQGLAAKCFPESSSAGLEESIAGIVSMEEEQDFEDVAKKALHKYKQYKASRRPSNSLCEQCGFTQTRQAAASLSFPKYSGFTQVNPRPESDAPRMVCPLCIFDALQSRKGLKPGKSQVYARVTTRIPELWQMYGDLKHRLDRLLQALTNVREVQNLSRTEFSDLPLPPSLALPILKTYKETITDVPVHTEFGALFPLERVNNDASPKDLRAKYLAFFALLNMMGFEAHIGLEEQEGLFGEKVFEKRKGDWQAIYYEGLIVAILANTKDRRHRNKFIFEKRNKFIFIQDLLRTNPGMILLRLEEAGMSDEFFERIIVFFIRADMPNAENKGGVWKMKEILQDAAFFAEWIPKFFWTQKDYDSWRTGGSKYVVTKPVDRALNAIMQGDDFEEAYAKFLTGLKEDISGDKTKEGSKATIDVKDLESVCRQSKGDISTIPGLERPEYNKIHSGKKWTALSNLYSKTI